MKHFVGRFRGEIVQSKFYWHARGLNPPHSVSEVEGLGMSYQSVILYSDNFDLFKRCTVLTLKVSNTTSGNIAHLIDCGISRRWQTSQPSKDRSRLQVTTRI